jgi:CBS domain-containing protein
MVWCCEQSDKEVACVVVVDDKDRMAGMFTARDFLRTVVVPRLDATQELVSKHMSTLAITANPSYNILDCARLMLTQCVAALRVHAGPPPPPHSSP